MGATDETETRRQRTAREREWGAFERGLILGCALGNGQRFTTRQIAELLGYGGNRDGYHGAYAAMQRARIAGLHENDDGEWELLLNGDEY